MNGGKRHQPLTETWDCHVHFPYAGVIEGPSLPRNLDDFIGAMRKAGISRAVGNVWEVVNAPDAAALKSGNRTTLSAAEESSGFIIPQVMVNPHFPAASVDELKWALDNGIRMAGEICGYIIGHKYKGKGIRKILEAAGELGIAVDIHLYGFDQAAEFARSFPQTTFVFAHFGGLAHGDITRIAEIADLPNAMVDVSGTAVFRTGVPEHAIQILGAERVLFGTDYFIDDPITTRIRTELACPDRRSLELVMRENLKRLTAL
ncbi:MAG: amidohydrolase [Planctomycetes bacterium]|nr:amidohydrolase [Planctomycetota bacterium]